MTNPILLIIAPARIAQEIKRELRLRRNSPTLEILSRPSCREAARLLEERREIGMVLLYWEDADETQLPPQVEMLANSGANPFKSIFVRSPLALSTPTREILWDLGIADAHFTQPVLAPEFVDTLAAALRTQNRYRSLNQAFHDSGSFAAAKNLRELATLALHSIHAQQIGNRGALFCIQTTNPASRILVICGTGIFGHAESLALGDLGDNMARQLIAEAMTRRQDILEERHAVFYSRSTTGLEACLYLAETGNVRAWQRGVVGIMRNAVTSAIDRIQLAHKLHRTQQATVTALATLAEYRDVDTGEHVARVARTTTEIAQALAERHPELGIDEQFIEQIGLASILHDIGKIAIPETILLKAGPLDSEERRIMQTHALLGRDILLRSAKHSDHGQLLRIAAEIACSHHERYDGDGYPAGLSGDDIPLAARIVALVDVFDALTSLRPYKPAWPVAKALALIRSESGKHFDPRVVDEFLRLEARRAQSDIIVWNDNMSVGHSGLDFDHRRLMDIINRLGLVDDRCSRQVIEFILDDLVSYADFHFRHEESVMAARSYPGIEKHVAEHQQFCKKIETVRWEYFQGLCNKPRQTILDFLGNWLRHHILIEDMQYRPWLQEVREHPQKTPA